MHDVASSHWHEPEGTKRGLWGLKSAEHGLRRLHGGAGDSNLSRDRRVPGAIDEGAIDIRDGGTAIPYWDEDPFIRQEYEQILKAGGVPSQMDASLYVDPLKT
jgi:hypothetical protein